MKRVFLSGGFPSLDRSQPGDRPFFVAEISAAVSAAIEATLRDRSRLVFGGHPAFTPIVLRTATLLGLTELVTIYQSEYFSRSFPAELIELERAGAELIVTESPNATDGSTDPRGEALRIMRSEMLQQDFNIGLFIAGMDGVEDELALFRVRSPDAPACLFVRPGGRSARLAGQPPLGYDLSDPMPSVSQVGSDANIYALRGRAYLTLAQRAVGLSDPPEGIG